MGLGDSMAPLIPTLHLSSSTGAMPGGNPQESPAAPASVVVLRRGPRKAQASETSGPQPTPPPALPSKLAELNG